MNQSKKILEKLRWSREVHGMNFVVNSCGLSKNQEGASKEQKILFRKHLFDKEARDKSFEEWKERNR